MRVGMISLLPIFVSLSVSAHEGKHHGKEGHHRPPKEAVEACKDKAADAACTFKGFRGQDMSGVCKAHGDKPLACKPTGAAGGGEAPHGDHESND